MRIFGCKVAILLLLQFCITTIVVESRSIDVLSQAKSAASDKLHQLKERVLAETNNQIHWSSSCIIGTGSGKCGTSAECQAVKGTALLGICPDSSHVCCQFDAAAATSVPPTPKVGAPATPVRKPLPQPGQACSAFGSAGVCKETVKCTKGRPYPGWCGGAATIQCCVPTAPAPAVAPGTYKATQRIIPATKSRADRLSMAEHESKFNLFVQKFNKQYKSAAERQTAFQNFIKTRERNVDMNDGLGVDPKTGLKIAMFSSLTPLADLSLETFRAKYLNPHIATANAPSFLETEDLISWEPSESDMDAVHSLLETTSFFTASQSQSQPALPSYGQTCSVSGVGSGRCLKTTECSGKGTTYSRLCSGAADVRCCVPFATPAPRPSPTPAPRPSPTPAPTPAPRPQPPAEDTTKPLMGESCGTIPNGVCRISSECANDGGFAQSNICRYSGLTCCVPKPDPNDPTGADYNKPAIGQPCGSIPKSLCTTQNQCKVQNGFAQTGLCMYNSHVCCAPVADPNSPNNPNNPSVPDNTKPDFGQKCHSNAGSVCSTAGTCRDQKGTAFAGLCRYSEHVCCVPGIVSPDNGSSRGTRQVTGNLTVDYRNLLTPMKNQKSCGSCWAQAAIQTVESAYIRKTGQTLILSPQYLVDCDSKKSGYGNCYGCDGGFSGDPIDWMNKYGTHLESDYPYEARDGNCTRLGEGRGPKSNPKIQTVKCAYNEYPECADPEFAKHKQTLAALQQYGPLSVSVDAAGWGSYNGGIFKMSGCSQKANEVNHAVSLVGFGEENGVPFWLVRNSWGPGWGEQGFIRIQAFTGNSCGITTRSFAATIQ